MTTETHLNGAPAPTDKAARRKRFEDVFPVIAEELLGYVRGEGMPKDAVEWYERVSPVSCLSSPLRFTAPSAFDDGMV
jgi:farnesyl diphosphate synthase